MERYYDIESQKLITRDELKDTFEMLKAEDPEGFDYSFGYFESSCLDKNGSLIQIVGYAVYEIPEDTSECDEVRICEVKDYEEAVSICEKAKNEGKDYILKVISFGFAEYEVDC